MMIGGISCLYSSSTLLNTCPTLETLLAKHPQQTEHGNLWAHLAAIVNSDCRAEDGRNTFGKCAQSSNGARLQGTHYLTQPET